MFVGPGQEEEVEAAADNDDGIPAEEAAHADHSSSPSDLQHIRG